jgi:UDPglucose 6-dehydrogenase
MSSPVTNIAIIGYGIVGQAVAHGFSTPKMQEKYRVLFYDRFKESESLESVVNASEFIFICLPTPMKADESGIDLSIIEEMVAEVAQYTDGTDKVVVIKSTVVPGTTQRLQEAHPGTRFCFNPEFLRETSYLHDALHPDRIIVGTTDEQVAERVSKLFRTQFPYVHMFHTDPTTAEMVKYMANMYLAQKVMFANEMASVCAAAGIEYADVKSIVVGDHRIFDSHLDIHPEGGFGGKCFPKDLVAIRGRARELGVEMELLSKVWELNKRVRKVKDWEEIPFAVTKDV